MQKKFSSKKNPMKLFETERLFFPKPDNFSNLKAKIPKKKHLTKNDTLISNLKICQKS